MTMTVGARSLDNEERSNFRDYMSLLSLSVDASMTVREVMAVAYLIGRRDALRDVRNASSPARTVNRGLIHGGPSDCVFNRGYEAGAGMVSDEIDALMRDVEALSGDDAVFSMLRQILLFVVLAVACFGLLLPFLRLAVGIVLLVVRLLASLARSMGAGR
ncbi:MAG: hypothetical protein E7H70_03630 [Bifidobacterium breve]|nr:hypothetical protein [Bifidobacterium breve]